MEKAMAGVAKRILKFNDQAIAKVVRDGGAASD